MARTMSVDLSITITAAVPSADFSFAAASKSISRSSHRRGRQEQRHRRAARDHGEQVVPAAAHAAGMALDQLAQRDAHLLFDVARLVHVAGNAEQLGAGVVRPADAANQAAPRRMMSGRPRDGLDVVDRGRAAVEADIGRERRLEPRHALLAFQAFQQRGLLAADIGAGAVVDVEVEVEARAAGVLADQPGLVGLDRSRPAGARARG